MNSELAVSEEVELKVKVLKDGVEEAIAGHMSEGSSGFDLSVCLDEPIVLEPMQRALVPTGIAISIPEGFEGQVRPRSGLAIKHGITLLNTPGTIDSDYRGEVKLIIINLGNEPFEIVDKMRMAQLVISRYASVTTKIVASLDETERGEGGFGHTGI